MATERKTSGFPFIRTKGSIRHKEAKRQARETNDESSGLSLGKWLRDLKGGSESKAKSATAAKFLDRTNPAYHSEGKGLKSRRFRDKRRLSFNELREQDTRKFNDSTVTYSYSLLITFQTLLSSSPLNPTRDSQRLLWSGWLIFVLLFSYTLVGTIVTRILNHEETNNVRTIQDLLDYDVPFLFVFKNVLKPINNSMINKLIDKSKQDTHRRPKAFLTSLFYRMYTDSINMHENHEYYKVPECVYRGLSGYTMLYEHPLRDVFHSLIYRFIEAGFYEKWLSEYKWNISIMYDNKTYVFNTTHKEAGNPFSLKDLQPAFYFYLFGIFLSSFVFIVENILFRLQSEQRKRTLLRWNEK